MPQSENRNLMLSVLAGAAGVSLAILWYQRTRKSRTARTFSEFNYGGEISKQSQMTADGGHRPVLRVQGTQMEMLEKLNCLVKSVEELTKEVKLLKKAIPNLESQVQEELNGGVELRRTYLFNRPSRRRKSEGRERLQSLQSEGDSEGGYVTAYTDTEDESDVLKLTSLVTEELLAKSQPDEYVTVLEKADNLHKGLESERKEGFKMLLKKKEKYKGKVDFLWRLARAYGDMFNATSVIEEKKKFATTGKTLANEAIALDDSSADSHKWFALMCGYMSEYETVQNKIKNGYLFKEHLDKAIELRPKDPLLYYLLGRWCYAVSQLSWLERKIASTLFGNPPSASIEDALQQFLKVEELQTRFSKNNYVFLAKCYKDLGQKTKAVKWCESAASMPIITKEDEEAARDLDTLLAALK
ncbi:regulator of microtubule dynamics protein 2 [Latimeria chalumnae]|uniref:Regulator of microtubule dynamics protein 2 n=1 Tax=Latimeria chalumnae TaxID=7897 RepID=H3B6K0_LATCH|nr:PREDICTED: regulator of microtubule dynamics protein 2 isoform X2 [Latimeria chalumnae]XP_014344358.1 PREDICTED: regulator of microtubule dynamics protein 2 isoform X2 [Latimeria chalumnae]|eukprot:XP_014344357.1 PREDICTED: regulator of microtubule dynamics protein 2 isoform X2 [Latimeria chalumnae]